MRTPFLKSEQLENYALSLGYVHSLITLNGNTAPASITTSSTNPGVKVFAETSGQPTVSDDTQTNFGTLDSNAAPSTVGVLVLCKDAAEYYKSIVTVVSSASMTAGPDTKAGSSTSGVTALLKNVAFVVSCTALDLDASIAAHVFQLETFYRKG